MSLNAATIELLLTKGLTGADLLDVARAMEKKRDNTNAERQARHRDRRRSAKEDNARYSNGVTPPNDNTLTPSSEAKASKPVWACPENVDPDHWTDFLANRKRKKAATSQTALNGVLKDLAQIADDEWPPGRLVELAAAKGWASIVDPRNPKYERPHSDQPNRNAAARAILAEMDAGYAQGRH